MLEKPPEPLTSSCEACAPHRTVTRSGSCLRCVGCHRCGSKSIVEDVDDSGLLENPIRLRGLRQNPIKVGGDIVRGDWVCLACGQLLVDWSSWRRSMLAWLRGRRALTEGYRRRDEAA
jgi:hypothetical protein